jgi:hypothetical protein
MFLPDDLMDLKMGLISSRRGFCLVTHSVGDGMPTVRSRRHLPSFKNGFPL